MTSSLVLTQCHLVTILIMIWIKIAKPRCFVKKSLDAMLMLRNIEVDIVPMVRGQMELCLVTGVEDHSPGKWSDHSLYTAHCTLKSMMHTTLYKIHNTYHTVHTVQWCNCALYTCTLLSTQCTSYM